MIYIDVRTLKSGAKRYRPQWREGGTEQGQRMTETFDDHARALKFAQLVEGHGKRLPPIATMRAAGFDEIAEKYDRPAPAPAPPPPATVADWCERYLDTLGPPSTSENTIASYRTYLINHVANSELGRTPVTRTAPDEEDFKKWRNAMSASGGRNGRPLAGSTVKRVMVGLLRPAMDMVARKGRRDPNGDLPLDNPMDPVKAPAHTPEKQTRLATDEQMRIVYQAACLVSPFMGDVVLFMLATGLRWGEVFGLTRFGLNLPEKTLTVKSVARRRGGKWVLSPKPKTRAGWRDLAIPAEIVDMVQARYDAAGGQLGLIFPAESGGVVQYDDWHDQWAEMLEIAERLGLTRHITAHGLRRTNITRLHLAGVPNQPLTVAAGHSDPRLTLGVYVDGEDTGRQLVAVAADGIIKIARAA
jgi:integrase